MPGFLSNRKRQKLYKEWVKNSGLSTEDVPETNNGEDEPVEETSEDALNFKSAHTQGIISIRINSRFIFYLILTVVILAITTATLSTVLIMRSC